MRIILGSITASAKLYGVPSWLVVVVVLGLCPPLLGGWFAQSTGNWDLFGCCLLARAVLQRTQHFGLKIPTGAWLHHAARSRPAVFCFNHVKNLAGA